MHAYFLVHVPYIVSLEYVKYTLVLVQVMYHTISAVFGQM